MFTTRICVEFGDTDPAGLVYYPNIFHYCHVAMERFFAEQCGTPYSSLIHEKQIGFPTVRAEADFKIPIVYGDEIDVAIEILSIGNSSIRFRYSIRRHLDQALCAIVDQVHVAMDLTSKRPISIPAYLSLPS